MDTYFKIEGGFVYRKEDGGDGIKYNIGDPIPETLLKNELLIETLLKSGKIGIYNSETHQRVKTKYDFLELPEEDIKYMVNTFGWEMLMDRVTFGHFGLETLKKLKIAVSTSQTLQNKESIVQAIDNKIRGIEFTYQTDSKEEAVADVQKKNIDSK